MARWRWGICLVLAWMCGAQGAETRHTRGEFHFLVGPPPQFVTTRTIPAAWDEAAPGAKDKVWRLWLADVQADRRGGNDRQYFDYAFQPRSPASLADAGRFQIEFNPGYQQLVIHRVELRRGGAWQDRLAPDSISLARRETGFEKDMADGQVTALIVLDDVRVDDVVRMSYTITGSNPVLAGQTMDWHRVGWRSAILDAHLRVLFDPGTPVRTRRENGAAEPQVLRRPDAVEVALDAHGNVAVVDEDSYPAWFQPFPAVQVGPDRSWGEVVAWAVPLFPAARDLPPDLEARIEAWSRITDPYARLAGVLRAVQDEVRYFGVEIGDNTHRPAAPEETWRRRYGDCKDKAYLLATILARLGTPAVPALVSTERGSAVKDFIPTAGAFNHAIVRATIGKDVLWLDPTLSQQGGDPRDVDLSAYGLALPVAVGSRSLEAIQPVRPARGGISTVETFDPVADGSRVGLAVNTTYRGNAANVARAAIAQTRSEELQRSYADYYRKRFGELEVMAAPTVEDDRDANVLRIGERYALTTPFGSEGSAVRALDVYAEALDGASQLPATMARIGPLFVGTPASYRHEVNIALPDDWRSLTTRAETKMASPAFDFSRAVLPGEKELRVVYDFSTKRRELDAASANQHLVELRKMRDALGARLRFQGPPSRLGAKEREERLKALLKDVVEGGGR